MTNKQPLQSARQAILDTLPSESSLFGCSPEPKFTHIPASHAKALHPDVQVVVGMRGSGKSFWWAALQNQDMQHLVAQRVSSLRLFEHVTVYAGFGERPDPNRYPGKDTLANLIRTYDFRLIWRTVVLNALAPDGATDVSEWNTKVRRLEADPEKFERILFELDRKLDQEGRYAIVLFDALDRSASDWTIMNHLIRGLLQTALELRPYRRVRMKCFLRTDQLDEQKVANFPDASKVLSSKLELTWPFTELYTMLFQYLGNNEDASFRQEVERNYPDSWNLIGNVWTPGDRLARPGDVQRNVFHAITGPWMGRDHRRGFPYSWVPGHLSDASGRTSPRSFLAAIREAAEDSMALYPNHEWPLHYESIKRGVQKASKIRKGELQEDVPWVAVLMEPLQGKIVPCRFDEIKQAWEENKSMQRLRKSVEGENQRLPPAHLDEEHEGLRQDLEALAIFLRMKNDRVNIPDVYRVAYGLGRKGGVKPLRASES